MKYEIGKRYDVTECQKSVDPWYKGEQYIVTCESIDDNGHMNVVDTLFIMWSLGRLESGLITLVAEDI